MRTRSCTVALAGLLVSFSVVAVANTALAAPKKKKAAAPAAEPAAEPEKEKDVDDMMQNSTPAKKGTASSGSSDSSSADEEPVGEPDAWERPPKEDEKPKAAPPPKVEEKYGDGRRIEIGLTPGFGLKAGKANWSTTINPYFLGLGIRGGYELDMKIFLGGGFVYHLGESQTSTVLNPGGVTAGTQTARQNYMLAFVEAGYDIWVDRLIIRPSMWLGMGFAIVDPYMTTPGVHTISDFMFAPGLNLIYVLDGIYIGGDVRYVAVTADGIQGLDFFFMIGLRFK